MNTTKRGNGNRVGDTQSTAYHSCSEPRLTAVGSCCLSASLALYMRHDASVIFDTIMTSSV